MCMARLTRPPSMTCLLRSIRYIDFQHREISPPAGVAAREK
jgi:hypothetical protein